MAEKKTKLKFQGRHHSKRGMISMLLALLVLAGFIMTSVMSGMAQGAAGITVGYIGIACLVVSVVGFVLGIRSLRERDILLFQPVFGMVVNAIMMLVHVVLYLIGMLI